MSDLRLRESLRESAHARDLAIRMLLGCDLCERRLYGTVFGQVPLGEWRLLMLCPECYARVTLPKSILDLLAAADDLEEFHQHLAIARGYVARAGVEGTK